MYLFIVIQSYYSDVGIWCQRWTFQRLNKALKVKEYNIVNENNSSLKLGWLKMIFAMLNTNSLMDHNLTKCIILTEECKKAY